MPTNTAHRRTEALLWVCNRIVMTMCGCDNLRDVVAFPKVQNASELMSQCPSPVDKKSLDELAIAVTEFEKDE